MASSGSGADQVKAKGPPPKGPPARKAPPAALLRQMGHATNRIDDASSTCSWTRVEDEPTQPSHLPRVQEDRPGEQGEIPSDFWPSPPPGWSTPAVYSFPPPPPAKASSAAANAPVMQAAQGLLDHSNENPTSRRLRRQQEQAARRGRRGVRWGQLAPGRLAHNPLNTALPDHLSQIGAGEGERSILVLDDRDRRVQSPFQGWLLDEVLTNALAGINVRSDRHAVRSPSTGYHLNLFMVRTLDSVKVTVCGSMTCYGQAPCAKWDSLTGEVMSHSAFQPFRWPPMTEQSPTWVDVWRGTSCFTWSSVGTARTTTFHSNCGMWLTRSRQSSRIRCSCQASS